MIKNKQRLLLVIALIVLPVIAKSQISVKVALCENKVSPVGVNPNEMFFSWEMQSDQKAITQSAYHLVISSTAEKLNTDIFDVYNSDVVKSDRSIQVQYAGKELQAAETYYWKIRVWDNNKKQSEWSDMQHFTTGIFKTEDWKNAQWIGYEDMPDSMRVVPFIHGKMKETTQNL